MTRQVIFREAQEVQPADLNNVQTYITDTLEKLIADAVGAGQYFSGFSASQGSTWVLSVAPGRRYADGMAYRNASGQDIDLFSVRPLSQRKVVALTTWGETIETDVQDRDYEINAETGETIPKAVAMERLRRANLDTIAGDEAAQPQVPPIPQGNVVIALVTLSTGGIETIAMQENSRTPQLARVLADILDLRAFEADAKQSTQRLRTDLFSIVEAIRTLASKDELAALRAHLETTRDVADRALALGQGDLNLEFIEYFQSEVFSDTDATGYAARVESGLKFPRTEEVSGDAITLLNPNDPKVSIVDNVMTPISTGKIAIDNTQGFNGAASLLGYTTTTQTTKRVTKTRKTLVEHSDSKRLRCGNKFPFGSQGRRDAEAYWPATKRIGGRTYKFGHVSTSDGDHWNEAFYTADAVYKEEEYQGTATDTVTETQTAQGRAQTFVVSSAGRLKDVKLHFAQVDEAGDVTVMICRADGNNPDQSNVVAKTTLAVADLVTDGPVTVPMPPEYLVEGRYSLNLLSGGNHKVRLSSQPRAITQGEHFAYDGDNKYVRPSGESDRDIAFAVSFENYASTQVVVDLNPVQMTGGMDGIVLEGIVDEPVGTNVYFRVQIGGQWQVLDLAKNGQRVRADFSTRPALVPLQVVYEGTLDKMPSIHIGGADTRAIAFQKSDGLKHVSEPVVPLSGATSSVKLAALVSAFVAEDMDCTLSLIVDGSPVAATASTQTLLENGDTSIVATFDLGSPAASYQAVIEGDVTGAASSFVGERLSHFIGA